MHDSLLKNGIRCYELFRDGAVAFEREGQLCFGPAAALPEFLAGNAEDFLVGEAAQDKVAKLHAQQRPTRSKTQTVDQDDGFAQTRRRWQSEKASGQWSPEFVRQR
jgi:hypothetical protein